MFIIISGSETLFKASIISSRDANFFVPSAKDFPAFAT